MVSHMTLVYKHYEIQDYYTYYIYINHMSHVLGRCELDLTTSATEWHPLASSPGSNVEKLGRAWGQG